jgi:nitronate monooxygenase
VPTNPFLEQLGIENPIILAPMGGGPCTPELVAAVSNAGGLGSLASAYQTPEQISKSIQQIRKLTARPFAVNLFSGGWKTRFEVDDGPMLKLLAEVHAQLELPPPSLPVVPPDPFPAQLEAVLEAKPAGFSFTFGIPAPEAMARLKELDTIIMGTATSLEEARLLADAGCDAVIAQGSEAGAHRGTFASEPEDAMIPTLQLVREIVNTLALPVIASGGLMDGQDIADALNAGASAVQLGTAFLACPECNASQAYKQTLLAARSDTTVITRAFSGRAARGLRNEFIRQTEGKEHAILPYPLQNQLTCAMRTAAAQRSEAGFLSLWAGQGVARIRSMPAAELVQTLVDELRIAQSSGTRVA